MSIEIVCPQQYELINGSCYHTMWPITISMVIGATILSFTNSLATLAGIGGGSMALVILMNFFHYLPKDASLVVFSCVLGAASGNTFNLLFKQYNNKPLIQFKLAYASIPIMFTGSFAGVLMNKFFPSFITYSLIVIIFCISCQRTYNRFRTQYNRQNEENLLHGQNVKDLHEQSIAKPFQNPRTVEILKNLGVLMAIMVLLSFIRGSSKFPSIIGLQPCSFGFWFFFCFSFIFTIFYAYRNIQILKIWLAEQSPSSQEQIKASSNQFDGHITELVVKSVGAGVLSGFGLGGGLLLVPMYRNLGCKPLEATATCAFGICITSFINCLQAVAIGAIRITQFGFFVIFLGSIAYFFSIKISSELRKRNRFSLVEGILLLLTIVGIINIPISLYKRYADNGHDLSIIFGFGRLC